MAFGKRRGSWVLSGMVLRNVVLFVRRERLVLLLRIIRRLILEVLELVLEVRRLRCVLIESIFGIVVFTTHFRSIHAVTGTQTTPASTTFGSITGNNMLRFSGNAFWTALGGLQLHDTAVGIANFNGDITIRGGVWTVLIHNPSTLDVKVKMFIQRTVDTPNFAFEPATASIAWDPTASPDFIDKVGKPYKTLEVLLEGGHNWSYSERIKLQKIDQVTYLGEGRIPVCHLLMSNVGHVTPITLSVTKSYKPVI